MKKFLSLVLALVMTMSLVTISAGATEYKDLTDKDDIQYAEAVAVLNKIGVITGYEDGSFKPTGNLTRGAAAKIIVSLMIGPTAAANLSVTAAPYKDVPVTNTFAAYIAYCKTAEYISGYGDNTFRPSDPLTGYAFAKMLLGALGYDGKVEGFTGSGWTMNVAKLSQKSGLLNDMIGSFSGNTAVTREVAAQLALNTLKATEVEYVGTTGTVIVGDAQVNLGNSQFSYVTSNNSKLNANIKGKDAQQTSAYLTLEFGEEHFPDLVLAKNTNTDDFGRPSNVWSYKNLKIGTYAKTANLSYNAGASGDTPADKVKDMGIKGYTVKTNTYYINGKTYTLSGTDANKLETIAKLTGNGTQVLLYLDENTANCISDVVAIQTQIMQVNKISTSSVTLKKVENDAGLSGGIAASTRTPVAVNAAEDDHGSFKALSALKADDFVIVTPVATSTAGTSYDVSSIFVPTTATGKITKVKLASNEVNGNGLTVDGTDYKLSYNWTVEDGRTQLIATSVSTKQDSTVYVDAFGYVIYAKDVKAATNYIVYDEQYSAMVDGKIHYYAQGYDMNGDPLSLDMGTGAITGRLPGQVWKYKVSTSNSNADYQWDTQVTPTKNTGIGDSTGIASSATQYDGKYFASSVKFLFLTFDGTDITSVTVKDGVQKVTASDATHSYPITYVTNSDGAIKTVIVGSDADVEISQNLMYVSDIQYRTTNSSGKEVSIFTAYIDGSKQTDLVANKVITKGFYTYAESDGVYTVNAYTPAAGAQKSTYTLNSTTLAAGDIVTSTYNNVTKLAGATVPGLTSAESLNFKNATILDLYTDDGVDYTTLKEMQQSGKTFTVAIQYNTSNTASKGLVTYMYILSNTGGLVPPPVGAYNFKMEGTALSTGNLRIAVTDFARPAYVPNSAGVSLSTKVYVNGSFVGNQVISIAANQTTGLATMMGVGCEIGDTVTVDAVDDVVKTPTAVKVLYLDKDGNTLDAAAMFDVGYDDIWSTSVAKQSAISFKDKSDTTNAPLYTITGLAANNVTTAITTGLNYNASQVLPLAGTAVADGNDYVTITLDTTNRASKFKVSFTDANIGVAATVALNTLCGYNDPTLGAKTLQLTSAPGAGSATIPAGGSAVITATLSAGGIAVTVNYGLKIVLTDGTKDYAINFKNDAVTTATVTVPNFTSDKALTVKSISNIAAPTVTKVFVSADTDNNNKLTSGDKVTIEFSEDLAAVPTVTTVSTFALGSGAFVTGSKRAVEYTVTEHSAATTVTIAGGQLESDTTTGTGVKGASGFTWTITTLANTVDCVPGTELTFVGA